ncbi:MAG: CoA transferase [Gammaproteobacteria bacterium]|nr:CoA transferase [Gammaproteobacteria bacterium]
MSKRAFSGIKVLDFCWVVIGPMLTRYLADFGAEVIRVESRSRLETLRLSQPFKDGIPGVNRSAYFSNYNVNKYGITVNMNANDAHEFMLPLIKWADVVTDNFTPGVMEKWGMDPEELRSINPKLVTFSASMLGRKGPESQQPGYGPVLTSLAGLSSVTGWPDRPASSPYGAYTDFLLPHLAISAISAALIQARHTGKGTHIELSQLEASLQYLSPMILDSQVNERIPNRMGNKDIQIAPHSVYRCKGNDRWLALACETDEQWKSLCKIIGNQSLLIDNRFISNEKRKLNEIELDNVIESWTITYDPFELMEICQRNGVPSGVVQSCEDLFNDSQLKHREHFVRIDHPEIGPHATDTNAFTLSSTPAEYAMHAPLLGQHNEWVCKEILGLNDESINQLYRDGVLE